MGFPENRSLFGGIGWPWSRKGKKPTGGLGGFGRPDQRRHCMALFAPELSQVLHNNGGFQSTSVVGVDIRQPNHAAPVDDKRSWNWQLPSRVVVVGFKINAGDLQKDPAQPFDDRKNEPEFTGHLI